METITRRILDRICIHNSVRRKLNPLIGNGILYGTLYKSFSWCWCFHRCIVGRSGIGVGNVLVNPVLYIILKGSGKRTHLDLDIKPTPNAVKSHTVDSNGSIRNAKTYLFSSRSLNTRLGT